MLVQVTLFYCFCGNALSRNMYLSLIPNNASPIVPKTGLQSYREERARYALPGENMFSTKGASATHEK